MHPLLLDLQGAADLVGVSQATARRWAGAGKVPATRVGGSWRLWAPTVLAAVLGPDGRRMLPEVPAGFVEPEVVSAPRLAELLGIHERTVTLLMREGLIPAQKSGQWRVYWPTIRDRIAAGQPLAAPGDAHP